MRKRLLWVLGLLALGLVLVSCAPNASQDSLQPEGPYAQTIKDLFVPVFWVAAAVFVIVEGGIVLILIRYRHRKHRDQMPAQTHGNTRLEIGWTILPAVVLAFVTVPTVAVIWDLAEDPPADALHITVEGHQWWWGFRYTDPGMTTAYGDNLPIMVGDVMVIPTGRVVYLDLASVAAGAKDDAGVSDFEVIHSFWVPQLAGKQDVVPGRTNHILLQADRPGTYFGQCAEFCGLQHGKMKFRVLALSPSDFDAWVANEKQAAAASQEELARQGAELFANGVSSGGQCIACHAIGGVNEGVDAGPNLTHFGSESHSCFAGCNWETTDIEALKAWLRDPSAVKLGAKMPNYHLTPGEIDALAAYLTSLT